ncbi:hypothetical protein diail_10780 [Diaporthe ilicicola]|nr:hypothetical protein diail_10780 [Diaporthe ilicicola]
MAPFLVDPVSTFMLAVRRKSRITHTTNGSSGNKLSKPAAIAVVVVVAVVLIIAIVASIIVQRRRKAKIRGKKHNGTVTGYSTDNSSGLYGGTPGYLVGGNGPQPHGAAAHENQSMDGTGQYAQGGAQGHGGYGQGTYGMPHVQRPAMTFDASPAQFSTLSFFLAPTPFPRLPLFSPRPSTESINNFSIFTFVRPADAVRETYRTLCPGGLAVVSCWRRFASMFIVHAAQKKIRPDQPLMPIPGPEFCEEGVLQKVVEEGGFAKDDIAIIDKVLIVGGDENIAGLAMLMSGPMMIQGARGFQGGGGG